MGSKGCIGYRRLADKIMEDSARGMPLKCNYSTICRILIIANKYVKFVKKTIKEKGT